MTSVIAEHRGLLPFGWAGVWLFYVISGFVISRNFMAERQTGVGATFVDHQRRGAVLCGVRFASATASVRS
jgi:peptidoglycan/LPS O-acetylase OafA/YrhL